jgi:AcrR family transcriptional regulator
VTDRAVTDRPVTVRAVDTRTRILDATEAVLARSGPRKLNLRAIAEEAGVSRPTLYKYFGSKEELLLALAVHEKARFVREFDDALAGLIGAARLDRALVRMVEFQRDYPLRELVGIEPAFMLDQLAASLGPMRATLVPLFEDVAPGSAAPRPEDLADLVVRAVVSHFLIRGDDGQLLRELRHVAGLPDPTRSSR